MEACKQKAENLVDAALQKFPTAHIIISGILPRLIPTNKSNAVNGIISQLNATFSNNWKNTARVSFADHVPTFVSDDGLIQQDLYWDFIHLNNHGLGKLVVNLRQAIDSSYPTRDNQLPKT